MAPGPWPRPLALAQGQKFWPLALGPRPYIHQLNKLITQSFTKHDSTANSDPLGSKARGYSHRSIHGICRINNELILQGQPTLPYPVWVIRTSSMGKNSPKIGNPITFIDGRSHPDTSMQTKTSPLPGPIEVLKPTQYLSENK